MKICVVSDVHFKYQVVTEEDRARNEVILDFFRSLAGKYDRLILAGDIFDLWFDWKYCLVKQYFPLLKCLADIRERACEIVYISGNHDFWFGDFFPDYLGVELVADNYTLNVDAKKILVTHGDLYTVNDMRYKLFRSIIRLPMLKNIFALLHPDFAMRLGSQMSRTSRKRISPMWLRKQKTAGLEKYAAVQIQRGYDIVVMGHSHEPRLKEMNGGHYGNCGDWLKNRSYIKIIDGKIELSTYSASIDNKEIQC